MGRATPRSARRSSATVGRTHANRTGITSKAQLDRNFDRVVTMDDNFAIARSEKEKTNARSLVPPDKGVRPIMWFRVVNNLLLIGFGDRPDLGDTQHDDPVKRSLVLTLPKPSLYRRAVLRPIDGHTVARLGLVFEARRAQRTFRPVLFVDPHEYPVFTRDFLDGPVRTYRRISHIRTHLLESPNSSSPSIGVPRFPSSP